MGKKFDIVRQAKVLNVAVSCCMIIAGVLLFLPLFSSSGEKILMGILYVVVGVAKITGFFSNDMYRLAFQFDLGFGLFALILGTLFLASPDKFNATFPNSIGLYAIMESALKLQIAYDARAFGIHRWKSIFVSALGLCAIGILTVISFYSRELSPDFMIPIAMMGAGVENAWVTAYTVRVRAHKKKFTDWLEEEKFEEEDA